MGAEDFRFEKPARFKSCSDPMFEVVREIYGIVHETHRYEGNGIWNRFNILVSLHMVLFGAAAFIYSSPQPGARTLLTILSVAGCLLSLWAVHVLRRLWLYHGYWKDWLVQLEHTFPLGLPRPFSSRPPRLNKGSTWYRSWFLAYTQPFMFVLFLVWVSLGVYCQLTLDEREGVSVLL